MGIISRNVVHALFLARRIIFGVKGAVKLALATRDWVVLAERCAPRAGAGARVVFQPVRLLLAFLGSGAVLPRIERDLAIIGAARHPARSVIRRVEAALRHAQEDVVLARGLVEAALVVALLQALVRVRVRVGEVVGARAQALVVAVRHVLAGAARRGAARLVGGHVVRARARAGEPVLAVERARLLALNTG